AVAWKVTFSSSSRRLIPRGSAFVFFSASRELSLFARSAPSLPVSSTTTIRCVDLEFISSMLGTIETAATNKGRIRVVIQKALVLARCRYSRFATTTILLGRIAHRLQEDLLQLRLFGAELVDVEEFDHPTQRLGSLSLRPQHQLHDVVLDRRLLYLGHR